LNTFEGRYIAIEDHATIDQEEDDISSKFCKFSVRFYYLTAAGDRKSEQPSPYYYWFPFFLQETPLFLPSKIHTQELTRAIFFPFFVDSIFNSTHKTCLIHIQQTEEDNKDNEDSQLEQSPKPSAATMSTTNDEDPNFLDINIDPDYPWMSAMVVLVLSESVILPQSGTTEIPTRGTIWTVSKLTIYFNVTDVQDFQDKKITASIESDGSCIYLNCVARIFHNNMSAFLTQVNPLAQQAEILAHGAVASKMKKQKSRQMKELCLKFPYGMTVNNSCFNGEAEEKHNLEVTIDVRKCPSVATRNGHRIEQKYYFGHLSVVVDDTLQSMELFDDKK
jgi:hypothetical protein